jgi:hypothetical protein
VDARADISSFGIVLFEMLTGRHPGVTGSTAAPDVSTDGLIEIARGCTELDPAARIQSASMLVHALDHLDRRAGTARSAARWWWEFHQATVAAVYGLTLWPAWNARQVIGGGTGRTLFIVIVGAAVVSASLRLHLWFTSRLYPVELRWVRKRSAGWIRAADVGFSAALVSGALLIRVENSSVDVLLLSIGLGAAVGFLVIEAATTRAAFKGDD